ncbi:MAG: ATP-binding cassette domain-containing protein [Moraxellaceae bacterium]|nr:ATP-binding cassette domain-containing protein [Moraxellaceae bacterium]
MATTTDQTFRLRDTPGAILLFLGEERSAYAGHLAVFALGQTYELLPPLLLGMMVDMLIRYRTGDSLLPLAALILGLGLSSALVAVLRLRSRRRLGEIAFSSRFRAKVWGFERLMDFSLTWHRQEATGNKAQRIQTGADAVGEWTGVHNDLLPPLVAFLGCVLACALLHWASALFFVAYVAGIVAIEVQFDRKALALSRQLNVANESASGALVEQTGNILAVKALGAGTQASAQVARREAGSRDLGHAKVRLHTTKWMWFQIYNNLCWMFFLAGIAAAVLDGMLSVGLVLTYTTYFANLRTTTTSLTDRFQTLISRHADLARLMPLFHGKEEHGAGTQAFPEDWDRIRFNDIRVRHDGRNILDGFELEVMRGERLGITGPSGCGKSTLLRLLLALQRPDGGQACIGSTPVTDIQHEALTRQVGIVLQESELFSMSLRDNITLGRSMDAARLRRVCTIACLDELIGRLPLGLDTVLGERGYTLSGGERQRIGIARAIARQPGILLLDEATSALDDDTERRVMQQLITDLPADTTLIVVAHRAGSLRDTTRLVSLAPGAQTPPPFPPNRHGRPMNPPVELDTIRAYLRIDDRLATSGQPKEAQIAAIAQAGYTTLINLALHDDPRYSLADEAGCAAASGLRYVHIPVQFSAPTTEDLQAFFNAMDRTHEERVWVHCASNIRVSIFLGLYRVIRLGWDREAAFAPMRALNVVPDAVWQAFIDGTLAAD